MASRQLPLFHPKVLTVSVALGAAAGAAGGALVALVRGTPPGAGAAGGIALVGLVALFGALLGAIEPSEGWPAHGPWRTWANPNRARPVGREERMRAEYFARRPGGRRSLAARVAASLPALAPVTSPSLLAWGVVVGGGLTAGGLVLVELARTS